METVFSWPLIGIVCWRKWLLVSCHVQDQSKIRGWQQLLRCFFPAYRRWNSCWFSAFAIYTGFASAQGFWLTWVGLFHQYRKARKGLRLASFPPAKEHSSEDCPQTFLLGCFYLRPCIRKNLLLFLLCKIPFFISVALASPRHIATIYVLCSWPPPGPKGLTSVWADALSCSETKGELWH